MALEVYFPNDIRNALVAAQHVLSVTSGAAALSDEYLEGFQDGFHAALEALAKNFGLGGLDSSRITDYTVTNLPESLDK